MYLVLVVVCVGVIHRAFVPFTDPGSAYQRGTRQRIVRSHPDSVYGDRMPVDLQWDDLHRRAGNQPGSSCALPKQLTQNPIPGSSCAPPPPHQTTTDTDDDTGEDPVNTLGQVRLNHLVQEGGVEFIAFLLNKAVPMALDQPVFYKDIARLPYQLWEQWKKACQEELEALHKRKVFELADLPKGRKAIKNHWVFMTKSNGHKKARLVAKGFSQIEGIDFDQIFSPVVQYKSVHLLLVAVALEGWHIEGLNVKSAFLYRQLYEEIYMEQPKGFKIHGQEWKVLHLCQAIYGLKQAALAWWKELLASMHKIGFERIDICYHYIRECIKDNKVSVVFVPGNDNPADMFTKNSDCLKFVKFWEQLGLTFGPTKNA